jgi:hypothetical protein
MVSDLLRTGASMVLTLQLDRSTAEELFGPRFLT